VDDELARIWKEDFVAKFDQLSRDLRGEVEKIYNKYQSR
jgi:hypothetical protein